MPNKPLTMLRFFYNFSEISGREKGSFRKASEGVFSLEESLESLKSLNLL